MESPSLCQIGEDVALGLKTRRKRRFETADECYVHALHKIIQRFIELHKENVPIDCEFALPQKVVDGSSGVFTHVSRMFQDLQPDDPLQVASVIYALVDLLVCKFYHKTDGRIVLAQNTVHRILAACFIVAHKLDTDRIRIGMERYAFSCGISDQRLDAAGSLEACNLERALLLHCEFCVPTLRAATDPYTRVLLDIANESCTVY